MNQVALSSRARRILDYLLRLEEPASTAQIASRLELSAPQVRYCSDEIELWLQHEGSRLIRKPKVGNFVPGSESEREALIAKLRSMDGYCLVLEPDERQQLLLLRILTAHSPISLNRLRKELAVSRTTLFRDLSSVRAWFDKRGLVVENRRGDGVFLRGPEVTCRQALLELLSDVLGPGLLIATCLASDPSSIARRTTNGRFLEEVHGFLKNLDLGEAERITTQLESELRVRMVDAGHARVILSVALAIQRVSLGRQVTARECPVDSPPTAKEAKAAREMAHLLEEATEAQLSQGEIQYLTNTIVGALKMGFIARGSDSFGHEQISDEALEAAELVAKTAAKYLHPKLLHDRELAQCLALELDAAPWAGSWVGRGTAGSPLNGSVAQDPLCRLVRRVLVPVLESQSYAADNQLLSSIAEHVRTALERIDKTHPHRQVWIVCASGVATGRNLVARLNLQIPELGILGVASAFQVARDPGMVSQADAVISTIPLQCVTDTPVVTVDASLPQHDGRRMKTELELETEHRVATGALPTGEGPSMADILLPDAIVTDVTLRSWEGVVDFVGDLLLQQDAIWPSYIEAMKDIVRLYGPYVVIAPGAALLHAGPEMGGRRLAMSLATLRTPVPFGHETHDPVRLALAFSSVDRKTHVRAVGQAIDMLGDEQARQSLMAAPKDRILEIIEDVDGTDTD